jgi:hypothetical protein
LNESDDPEDGKPIWLLEQINCLELNGMCLLRLAVFGIIGINLRIMKDDPVKGAVIEHLTEEVVASADQLVGVVARGENNRHFACTNMNAHSR